MSEGPISNAVVKFWSYLAMLGTIRFFLTFLILGIAFLGWGNTAGRIIGVVFLLIMIVFARSHLRERHNEPQAKAP